MMGRAWWVGRGGYGLLFHVLVYLFTMYTIICFAMHMFTIIILYSNLLSLLQCSHGSEIYKNKNNIVVSLHGMS